jgi:hypothetical protein
MKTPITGQALEALKFSDPFLRGAMPVVRRDPGDASIGTGDFTQGVPAFWFARSLEYGTAETLYTPYADSPWVRSAIQKISQPVSSCEILFTKPSSTKVRSKGRGKSLKQLSTSRGIIYRSEDELLDVPQITAWLKEPVRDLTYQDFVEASIGWLNMQECFWVMDDAIRIPFPNAAENPSAPIRIARPDRMRPTVEDGEIIGWTFIAPGGQTMKLLPDQVVRLRGWNPYDEFRGLGNYRAAHIAAEADWLASKFSRNLMANNGDTSRIISVKGGQPTDTQRAQLIQEFKARREASLRGQSRDVVVGGEVELHNAEMASVDPAFISQRLENRHEIYIAFGVPPSMADIKASYSIGSASDMFQLLINTCIPTGAKFCGALEKLIYKLTGERVEAGLNWDEHPCMQEVRKERLDSIAKLASQGMPMEEINEYLALGMVKYPGWEVGYLPINVTPVLNQDGEVNPALSPKDFSEENNEPGNPPTPDGGGQLDGDGQPSGDGKPSGDGQPAEVKAMLLALRDRAHGHIHKSGGKNKQIWEAHMKLRAAAIKQYQGKVSKLFMAYRAKALKHLASADVGKHLAVSHQKSLVDILFSKEHFSRELLEALEPVTQSVLQRAGEELYTEIGQDDPWKLAPKTALDFIRGRDKLLEKVGDTAQSQLNTSLAEGLANGDTTEQLTDRVRGVFNKLQNFEARRIAMTETSAAYGFSRHKAMNDAGVEYKSWLSSHGPTVREAHAAAEAQYGDAPIPIDEPFVVDGEDLMYPGDESGSPGNVINCHCIQIAVQNPQEQNDE